MKNLQAKELMKSPSNLTFQVEVRFLSNSPPSSNKNFVGIVMSRNFYPSTKVEVEVEIEV